MLHSFNPLDDRTPRRLSAATRELAARISNWSPRFATLDPAWQDMIIARSIQGETEK